MVNINLSQINKPVNQARRISWDLLRQFKSWFINIVIPTYIDMSENKHIIAPISVEYPIIGEDV